jgi:hypothetical protein
MVLFTFAVRGSEYEEIVEVLKYVETANQPHLIGDNGASWGVLQIQKSCVDDVNRYFGTNYTHNDMFNVACAEEVAILYMQMGAELYEKRTGRKATEEVLVRNHNGGIYRGYRINATRKYYRKYLKWKSIIKSNSNGSIQNNIDKESKHNPVATSQERVGFECFPFNGREFSLYQSRD